MICRALSMAVVLILMLWLGVARAAQAPPTLSVRWVDAREYPTISVVAVVGDEDGDVAGLSPDDFAVEDGETPVQMLSVSSVLGENARLALALLIDRSGSMKGEAFQHAVSAADDMVSRLSQGDLLTAAAFSGTAPNMPVPSTDHIAVTELLQATGPGGNTAIWDAVTATVASLSSVDATRKAVVLLTDGKDTASSASYSDCVTVASEAGVAIYAIRLGQRAPEEDPIEALAQSTGGAVYYAVAPRNLRSVYRSIAKELNGEYIVKYRLHFPATPGSWRVSTVRVSLDDGVVAEGARQYLAPQTTANPTPQSDWRLPLVIAIFIAALLAMNMALAIALLRRKHRATDVPR